MCRGVIVIIIYPFIPLHFVLNVSRETIYR